jgi:hypothetical protein
MDVLMLNLARAGIAMFRRIPKHARLVISRNAGGRVGLIPMTAMPNLKTRHHH